MDDMIFPNQMVHSQSDLQTYTGLEVDSSISENLTEEGNLSASIYDFHSEKNHDDDDREKVEDGERDRSDD